MNTLKIGAVSYLNTRPLVFGLESDDDCIELIFDLPSRLADRMASEELDVALIPVIEAVCNAGYTVVSDACIACRGPVCSVKLFSRVPIEEIRSVALDEGSRTSAALAKIILTKRYSVDATYTSLPIHQPWRDSKSDAVLVIGDRAMHASVDNPKSENDFRFSWDLGEYWNRWTELPFVFAVWAARPGVDYDRADSILCRARDSGLENIDTICRSASNGYEMSDSDCRRYLTSYLHYFLGDREKMGLELFLKFAAGQSLIDKNSKLQFHDCQITR